MKYGLPYKGSKNQIAEWVYSYFPKATNFYNLFAGGCAITKKRGVRFFLGGGM